MKNIHKSEALDTSVWIGGFVFVHHNRPRRKNRQNRGGRKKSSDFAAAILTIIKYLNSLQTNQNHKHVLRRTGGCQLEIAFRSNPFTIVPEEGIILCAYVVLGLPVYKVVCMHMSSKLAPTLLCQLCYRRLPL